MKRMCLPFPHNRRILGGPSNALKRIVIRPFPGWRMCEIVSTPGNHTDQNTSLRVIPCKMYADAEQRRNLAKKDKKGHIPLPVRSSYQTLVGLSTWKQFAVPLGETLTCPSPCSAAVATQNICCFKIHSISFSGISS